MFNSTTTNKYKEEWEKYRTEELDGVKPIVTKLGFVLNENQVHIGGERYAFSGHKLVLVAHRASDMKKVIIKTSSKPSGINEIEHERKCRMILKQINFAYHALLAPEEILFKKQHGYIIFITSFVEQKSAFLERPLKEQFFLALKAFEMQEGVHTTTYEHAKIISKVFGVMDAKKHIKTFEKFKKDIILQNQNSKNTELDAILTKALYFLKENKEVIDLYSGFLTHWDFVPHNIRVVNHDIYLLDHSSFRFGNKYESWARFINFMTLYNRPLEKILVEYVQKNRTKEEFLSLKLMRIFRLTGLIRHYINTVQKSSGDLIILNQKRIEFWTSALEAVLNDEFLNQDIIEEYKSARDGLRSDEEKKRQKELY